MKKLVIEFGEFINEMYSEPEEILVKKSSCCEADIEDDGTCSECGAVETNLDSEEEYEPKYDEFAGDFGDDEEMEPDSYLDKPTIYEEEDSTNWREIENRIEPWDMEIMDNLLDTYEKEVGSLEETQFDDILNIKKALWIGYTAKNS